MTIIGVSKDNDIDSIIKLCESHEVFLKDLLRGGYSCAHNYLDGNLRFGVARRWNSWYPSYFDVEGGCYVFIPGDLNLENGSNKKDDRVGVVVIDPGFKFIDILRRTYQIEPQDIKNIIITHFHPDHMAGLLEYATIMNTSKLPCNIYLNETAYSSYKSLQNSFITVNELQDGQIQEIMRYTTNDNSIVKLSVKAIGVHHNELGNQHKSLGLLFESSITHDVQSPTKTIDIFRVGILGDTDGNEQYIQSYVDNFQIVDILVLHLGSFSNKKFGRGGKHLYIDGVKEILLQLGLRWKKENLDKEKTIILSEFGLELADNDSLYYKLQPFISSYSWRLPLIYAQHYMEEEGEPVLDAQDGLKLFARGTIDNLCSLSNNDTKSNNEIIIAISYLVQSVAEKNSEVEKCIQILSEKIQKIIAQRIHNEYIDGIDQDDLLQILDREMKLNIGCAKLQKLFSDLLVYAGSIGSRWDNETLNAVCMRNISTIGSCLVSKTDIIFFIDEIAYIEKFSRSRNINIKERGISWLFPSSKNADNRNYFWTSSLLGVYYLHLALQSTGATSVTINDNNPLLQIGEYFSRDLHPMAKIIIGDIGLTIGFNPLDRWLSDRGKGIKILSKDGSWVLPRETHCITNPVNSIIEYHKS